MNIDENEAPVAKTDGHAAKYPKRPWIIGGGLLGAAIAAVLAFEVFGVHTLFFDETVSEDAPDFASGAQLVETEPDTPAAGPVDSGDEGEAESDVSSATSTPPTEPATAVTTLSSGTFRAVDHPGEGTVSLLSDGTQTFVRFEDDFATDNGPDLFAVVYVDGELIELGGLRGNRGSQNYELPPGIDPETVESVAVWCKRFDATFTIADLA